MATGFNGGGNRPYGTRPEPVVYEINVSDILLENLSENIFSEVAQAKAKIIADAGIGGKNKSTQLRKFYDELVLWNEKVALQSDATEKNTKYQEIAPFVKMMIAKVAYSRGRKHVDENFEKLFTQLINQIKDPKTLKNAKLFMEAFLGFYKALEKKDD
jgi:CRISPR-associated protein Csm2